jgi:hypothetical protein
MARVSDEEKQAIKQAATAAETLLPKLRQQRDAIDQRIASLEALVKASDLFNGPSKSKGDQDESGSSPARSSKKRAKKGQVAKHVDAVLSDGSQVDEATLRDKISETFHVSYGRATIYSVLRRGYKEDRYDKVGNKWKLGALTALKSA